MTRRSTSRKRNHRGRMGRQKLRRKLMRQCPLCWYCGALLNESTKTLDHIIPKSRGGTNDPDNLVLACKTCNQLKGEGTAMELLKRIWEVRR